MVKSILLAIVWFVAIYFFGCMLLGGIAGGIAGANNPENPQIAGAQAGQAIVLAYRGYIALAALAIAIAGAWTSVLPGTKRDPETA